MADQKTPVLIIPCPHGGYVVKQFAPLHGQTDILFAGSLQACADFIVARMSDTMPESATERGGVEAFRDDLKRHGLVVVPMKPTVEMILAADKAVLTAQAWSSNATRYFQAIYEAMLIASQEDGSDGKAAALKEMTND